MDSQQTMPPTAGLTTGMQTPAMEPGEIPSSPAHPAPELKRPLSPTAGLSSQDSKRVRTEAECLHCGCNSHRWTACMSKCSHCGQRHMGGRCQTLPLESYTPGGFKLNKHYHPPDEPTLPALKLTPVDAAVPEYTSVEVDCPAASDAKAAVSHLGEAGAGVGGGPAAVVQSIESQSTEPAVSDSKMMPTKITGGISSVLPVNEPATLGPVTTSRPSQLAAPIPTQYSTKTSGQPSDAVKQLPQATNSTTSAQSADTTNGNMDAGRAALIALTNEHGFRPSTPLPHDPDLGPLWSGANNMPLGQMKPSGMSAPVKGKLNEQQPGKAPWKPTTAQSSSNAYAPNPTAQGANQGPLLRGNVHAYRREPTNNARSTTTTAANAAARIMAVCAGDTAGPAPGQAAAYATPPPAVPAYGQTLFGNNNTKVAAGGNTAAVKQEPEAHAAHQAAANDLNVWSLLVQQIKNAVKDTTRPNKPFNGQRVNRRVNEAINILKPIILGAAQPPSNIDFTAELQQGQANVNMTQMQLPMGGLPMQPPPSPPAQPPPQPLPQLPPVKVVWNWATGTWEWKFE